jgi:crotonobetainyl-CoA:carnitine CoA-transferase CaiB-like acyl-CoA transferase
MILDGIRVIDFSAFVGGPFAAALMADLGASVIKVEPPTGDPYRHATRQGFAAINRNKRGLCIDLKHPDSAAVIERLASWADVALEGFRPGVADRLGIGAAQLRAVNPRLVYCSLSGYGQTGPLRQAPGHDFNFLAASGALAFKGHWNDTQPHRTGLPVTDVAGGSYSVIAILAALMRRQETGVGAALDVSFTDAMMSFTALRDGLDVRQPGREHLHPANDVFETADGRRLALGIIEQHFWERFVEVAAPLEPRLADPKFATGRGRQQAGDELSALVAGVIRGATAAQWLERLDAHVLPVHLVLSPYEASRSPQAQARGVVRGIDGERHIPFPVLCDGEPMGGLRSTAPALGAHGGDILVELEFGPQDIERMRRADGCCPAPTEAEAPK